MLSLQHYIKNCLSLKIERRFQISHYIYNIHFIITIWTSWRVSLLTEEVLSSSPWEDTDCNIMEEKNMIKHDPRNRAVKNLDSVFSLYVVHFRKRGTF
jgi:hypothetical protein